MQQASWKKQLFFILKFYWGVSFIKGNGVMKNQVISLEIIVNERSNKKHGAC